MRLIQWLCFIVLFALAFCFSVLTVNGQTLRGDALGLRPTALPTTCNIGDLRVDSADDYRLKLCNLTNTWSVASFADPMTTDGDLITQAAGVPARLGIGSTSHVLQVVGGTPAWGFVTDANVDASAGIVDTKLATIATAGKVSNSATTATALNTNDAIVARDAGGSFGATSITADIVGSLTGNADTATALANNPSDCSADTYANAIAANGNLTCATVTNAGLAGSIAASKLVGTDIATVGTVTSGTWNGVGIGTTYGGTGLSSYTAGDSIYATGSNTLGKVGIGVSGQVWTVTGASSLGWTTPTTVPTITAWVAYTPTISNFGTVTGVTFYSRRVGDSLEVHGTFGSGVSTSSIASFTIGFNGTDSNVTVDTAKISGGTACGKYAVGATAQYPSVVLAPGTDTSTLTMAKSSDSTNPLAGANADTIAGTGQSVQIFNVLVPITGW